MLTSKTLSAKKTCLPEHYDPFYLSFVPATVESLPQNSKGFLMMGQAPTKFQNDFLNKLL